MALISCPECGHDVSERAVACPSCGYPIGEETASQEETNSQEAESAQGQTAAQELVTVEEDTPPRASTYQEESFPAFNSLVIALVSAGVIIAGSLLPWVAVDSAFGTQRLVGGTQGDAVFALFAGILMVVVAGVSVAREKATGTTAVLLILLAGAAGLIAVNTFLGFADGAGLAGETPLASVRSGLWLVVVGSAAGVGAGASVYSRRDERGHAPIGGSRTGVWVAIVFGFVLVAALFIIGDESLQRDLGDTLREDIADRLRDVVSGLREP